MNLPPPIDVFTHPEVNVQVAATAKFAVADLEGHGHLVVGMELLVEAFARVGLELDVVGRGEADEIAEGGDNGGGREQHCGGLRSTAVAGRRYSGLLLELRGAGVRSVDRELPGCNGESSGAERTLVADLANDIAPSLQSLHHSDFQNIAPHSCW